MTVQAKTTRYKIDFAGISEKSYGVSHPSRESFVEIFGRAAKFPKEHSFLSTNKGQLFIVADLKTQQPLGADVVEMVINIIQENYFSYPSDDAAFSLQRAFDIANRQLYQYAQTHNLHKKFGITCSALVLKDKYAYIAHVGDTRVYHVSIRKIEQLTQDHTRVIEFLPPKNGDTQEHNGAHKRSVVTRALGIQLGVKIDTVNRIPIHRDEYFILCSPGIRHLGEDKIKNVVLSSSPQNACDRLTQFVEERTGRKDTVIQIVKIYNFYQDVVLDENGQYQVADQEAESEESSHVNSLSTRWSYLPIYIMLVLLMGMIIFLLHNTEFTDFSHYVKKKMRQYDLLNYVELEEASSAAMEEMQLATAREYVAANHLKEAEAIYSAILKAYRGKHPQARAGLIQIASTYRERGDYYRKRHQWTRALRYYTAASRILPENRTLQKLIADTQSHLQTDGPAVLSQNITRHTVLPPHPPEIKPKTSLILPVLADGFSPNQWALPGLDRQVDYEFRHNNLIFYDNIRIKKAFQNQVFDSIEVQVQAKTLLGNPSGRYGIIFGHQLNGGNRFRKFFLFTIDNRARYALQQVTPTRVRILVSGQIDPGIQGGYDVVQLKVKCIGKLIFLYVNGQAITIFDAKQPVQGGVGLYVDPKLSIEFSQFKVTPPDFQ